VMELVLFIPLAMISPLLLPPKAILMPR